ncbi:hypothetical protein G4L39_10150 [Limisphaera ngatamarikiensis]|uniref:Uncharacterized protein n=1 Tax=Limisphaera ngatamarikiensis TaxID=1324935 RepID=A0A6M1RYD0_9BACT|nr:hypothetical protein [Limisphaera ngatamarikiensis]NGO39752.1 hypothetical protein [Limisphaera ngatamarikiensis]
MQGQVAGQPLETHRNLQAVNADGTSAWSGSFPFRLRGVLLNNPEDLLDPTPNFLPWDGGANAGRMGGEWQVFLQAVDPEDRGGTACWMGQNYGNLAWLRNSELSYTNRAWVSEILRLEHDPETGHRFRAGDLVEVTVRQSLFYGGKRNINEGHSIDPQYDFSFTLLSAGYGLPEPELVPLSELVRPDDGNPETSEEIFDPTRATGCEHWQGMRIRIPGLQLVSDPALTNRLGARFYGTNGWNPALPWGQRRCTVTDGAGRYFTLRHPRYSLGPVPSGVFDAIGILNQESGSGIQGTNGYELIVQQIVLPPPEVDIARAVVVHWPDNGTAYMLESSPQLADPVWSPVPLPVVRAEGRCMVVLPPQEAQRYFRLRMP